MAIELVHAKLNRGQNDDGRETYMIDFVFGIPFFNEEGNHIGKAKTVHMSFLNGMEPDEFVIGLRALADHIEKTVVDSDDFKEKPDLKVVE